MLISFDAAMGIHPRVAQLRTSQLAVQAGNVFNVETPGYRALAADLEFFQPIYNLAVSDQRHISGTGAEVDLNLRFRNAGDISSDNGNDVSLVLEQAELAQSMSGFNISVSLIREQLSMLDRVISGR